MKRSEAPSNLKPSFRKKAKPDRLKETAVRMPPPTQPKTVRISPTPLNAKQLKSLQFLLSGASYASVLETEKTNATGLREKCSDHYHGVDEDRIGVVKNFLLGNDRFHVLWDSGRIASGFGNLSGLSRESIAEVIYYPTLKGKNLITGRQVLEKSRVSLREAKKYLAFWMEFLVGGSMPSGMTEVNALQYVMKRAMEEMSDECAEVDEEEEGNVMSILSDMCFMFFSMRYDVILTYG